MTITVTLSQTLTSGQMITVPLTVNGATVTTDYTFALSGTNTGVTLNTSSPHTKQNPALVFVNGAQTATMRLTPVDNSDRTQPYVVVAYGTATAAGTVTVGTLTGGPFGVVFVDDETGDIEVPTSWNLKPSSLSAGDDFRLIFRSSTQRDATSSDIAEYDAFIHNVIATNGHADIKPYSGFFKVFASTRSGSGSTGTTARVHNGLLTTAQKSDPHTGHHDQAGDEWADGSQRSTVGNSAGTPTYWLNGAILANNYADLCDLAWASGNGVTNGFDQDDPRSEDGTRNVPTGTPSPASNYEPWTGTGNGCEAWNHPLGSSTPSRAGYDGNGGYPFHSATAAQADQRPLYGYSPIFRVAGGTATVPALSITGGTAITEGGNASFTISATSAPSSSITVNYTVTQQGSFVASGHLNTKTRSFSGTSATFSIPTQNDNVDESNGSVTVTLNNGTGYTVGSPSAATVNLTDDDTAGITFSKASVTVNEGSTGTSTVRLDTEPTATATVTISCNSSDVTVSPTSLTFNASGSNLWSTAQTVTVSAQQDNDATNDTATLTHSASGGGYGSVSGSVPVTVNDDEATTPALSITGGTAVTEGGNASFTINASSAPSSAITVNYTVTQQGSFVASGQLNAKTRSFSGTIATFTIPTLNDNVDENNGSVTVTLNSGTGYTVGSPSNASVTVNANDTAAVSIVQSSGNTIVSEDGSTTTDTYTLRLATQPVGPVTITVTAGAGTQVDGPAAGRSWASTVKTNAFTQSNWSTPQTITVRGQEDSIVNPGGYRTVTITHSIASGEGDGSKYRPGTPSINSVAVRVNDNDTAPTTPVASFASSTSTASENAGSHNITVTLRPAPAGAITVSYNLEGTVSSVSVSAGATSVSIPVRLTDNDAEDGSRTIILTLRSGNGYNIGSPSVHRLTITDDEAQRAPSRRQPIHQDPPSFCSSTIHDASEPKLQEFPVLGYEAPALRPCGGSGQPGSGSGLVDLTGIEEALDEDQRERQRGVYITTQLQDIPDYRSRFRGNADNELYITTGEDEQRYNVIRPQNMIDLHLWLIKERPVSGLNTVEQIGRREALSVDLMVCIRDRSRGADRATNVAVWDPGQLSWRVLPMSLWLPDDKLCTLTNQFSSFNLVREIKPDLPRDAEGNLLLEAAGDSDPEPEADASEERSLEPEVRPEAEGEAADDPKSTAGP